MMTQEVRRTLFCFTGRKHLLQLKYLRGFNLFGLVGKLENSMFFCIFLNIRGEEALLVFPGQENHSQRAQISSTVNFLIHKSPETFIKHMVPAIKEFIPKCQTPAQLRYVAACSLLSYQR